MRRIEVIAKLGVCEKIGATSSPLLELEAFLLTPIEKL